MSDDLHLDGNGIDGLMAEALAADPSTMVRRCASCGQDHAMGEHRAYRGAGWVLRCPNCGDTAMVIGLLEQRLAVRTSGTYILRRPTSGG
jgi:predicted RNA-binding Zn-ribbon protein involved in translation (DUF1610 family)